MTTKNKNIKKLLVSYEMKVDLKDSPLDEVKATIQDQAEGWDDYFLSNGEPFKMDHNVKVSIIEDDKHENDAN